MLNGTNYICIYIVLPYGGPLGSLKCFFEMYQGIVQILMMLKVLFTQDSEVEDLFCDASPGSEPVCSSTITFSASTLEIRL